MSQEVMTVQGQIKNQETEARFSKIFSAVHKCTPEQGKGMHEAESFSFLKELTEKNITDVTPVSAMGVYLDVVRNGLSFSSASKHVYLMARSVKNGNNWEKRLVWDTTQDGKIYQCQKSGSINRVTKPVICYEGDTFEEVMENGVTNVIYKRGRTGDKVIGGFVYVVFPDGTREAVVMYPEDIERLKGYSARQNKDRGANALYSSAPGGQIDPGFFASKLIKFALKNVRKSGVVSEYQQEIEQSDAIYAETIPANNQPEETVSHKAELINDQTDNNEPF